MKRWILNYFGKYTPLEYAQTQLHTAKLEKLHHESVAESSLAKIQARDKTIARLERYIASEQAKAGNASTQSIAA